MVAVQCAAVPAMVSELVLALSDPFLGALTDCLHDVWVALTELPLLVHQSWDVVADHTGPQRPDVPDNAKKPKKLLGGFELTTVNVTFSIHMRNTKYSCD